MSARPERAPSLFQKKERSSPKLRLIFRPKFKRFFRPKSGGLQEKKKVFTEIETAFSAAIRISNVFSAQNQVVSKKKKKKVFTEIETDFLAEIGYPNVSGGAVFNFSQKICLKTTKNVRFCVLHKSMGGAQAPPGYATVLLAFLWR